MFNCYFYRVDEPSNEFFEWLISEIPYASSYDLLDYYYGEGL